MQHYLLVSAFANISLASNSRMSSIFKYVEGEKTVITTDFYHGKKRYYLKKEKEHPRQINLHVPSYSKNLSINRVFSHLVFAYRLRKYLQSTKEIPDAIYCTMPTSSSAYVCAKYCKKNRIKFIIDVIDLWPDSLLPLIKAKTLLKALLFPWTYMTRYTYKHADVIIGESVKYANEAKKYNKKAKVYPIYLGIDVEFMNKVILQGPIKINKPDGEIWIGYAGSLGNSYDFTSLLEAVKAIHGKYRYKLWFIGDGVKREEIEAYIKKNGLNVEITGYLPYEQLLGYLSYCDIAVNIFRANTKVVYSYKFNDYVGMRCFILNSLRGETSEMIDNYKIGRNFNFTDKPLSSVLSDTMANWGIYNHWRENTKCLIDQKLNKDFIYNSLTAVFNS